MTPSARVQAAIELLQQIIEAARRGGSAADALIANYFKTRRYAGSKDRRAVRDLVYAAIRRNGDVPESGRAAMVGLAEDRPELADLFDGSARGPEPIGAGEQGSAAGIAPQWLIEKLSLTLSAEAMPALLERAPMDLRVNRLRSDRAAMLPQFPGATPTAYAPDGIRLAEAIQMQDHAAWIEGLVEIQDEGSQLASEATQARPGMTVIDLCAGAGGKTLALAAMMADRGHLIACDSDRARLSRLMPRAARAGVTIAETRLLNPGNETSAFADLVNGADVVLIDAPCSGSGTWRRNPETRWRITPQRLAQLVTVQARLLDVGAGLVKPGGALVYVVCSLLAEEGRRQIADFLARHGGWSAEPLALGAGVVCGGGTLLSPANDGTDGFFIARLHPPC